MTRSRDIADQQENLGGAVAPFVAGKNKIINGDFGIWQRGTSITTSGVGYFFGADRWMMYSPASSTSTFSQQTFAPGTAPVAGYEGTYFARFNCTNSFGTYFQQYIEDVRSFAGQTVTLSFWAKAGSAISINGNLGQQFGTGGSSFVDNAIPAVSVTTSWQRFSVTVAVPSIAGKTIGTSSYLKWTFSTASFNVNIDIWGVQIESGNVVTPFTPAGGGFPGAELALCQRYYVRNTGGDAYSHIGQGIANATNQAYIEMKLPVQMRVVPTSIDYSTVILYDGVSLISTGLVLALLSQQSGVQVGSINASGITGLTQYRPYFIINNASASGYVGFSAEL